MVISLLSSAGLGLMVSCFPWFLVGMVSPRKVLPYARPTRWQVFFRYWVVLPLIAAAVMTEVRTLGDPGFSLIGFGLGVAANFGLLRLERAVLGRLAAFRDNRRRRQEEAARREEERRARDAWMEDFGLDTMLDPDNPPRGADDVVAALVEGKRRLLDARREDLALQADRLYARYGHVLNVLSSKFDRAEITFGRSYGLVAEVAKGAADNLNAMASLARGVAGVDADYARKRLARGGATLSPDETEALRRRVDLVEGTEKRLAELAGRNEVILTALIDAAVGIANVETEQAQASVAAETALQDLRRFVDRAEQYGRSA